ncbi:MAG: DMT family transporter [Proteobacteria bacterium]|nr:MAG: DMT family transporter [Pseudomonadota bacterium]
MKDWPLLGECAALMAAMIWAVSMSLYTRFGQSVSARHLNLFKNCVALICLGGVALFVPWHWPAGAQTYYVLALSGLMGLALGDTLLFLSLKSMGVQRTSIIQCLAPPFAALLAWIAFGERLVLWEWLGLSITVVFLALILKARSHAAAAPLTALGVTAALGAAVCQAFAMTSLRWSLQGVDVWTGTFLRITPSIAALTLFSLYVGDLGQMKVIFQPKRKALILTFAALIGTFLGLVLMSTGAKYAKAGVATALSSTTPIWILPIAHFMLGEKLSLKLLVLTLFVVCGVVLMILGPSLI